MPNLDIPDDGFLTVKIGDAVQTVDAYESFNHVNGLRSRYGNDLTPDEASEYNAGVVQHLLALGFPRVSQAAAAKFVDALFGAVKAIQGKAEAGPTPGSPASTEPPPSSSPEE
ncbi:MAG: hypothetical protein U0804_28745 [Gemmataceae bacterium]